jgi:hypothetical protein
MAVHACNHHQHAGPARGLKERPGVWKPTPYVDKMINAITAGSWSSTQFGIRPPWVVERRFLPPKGPQLRLWHYLETVDAFATSADVATPMGPPSR